MDPDDLITVHVVFDSLQAELIRCRLDTAGIANFLKSDNAGGVLPHLTRDTGGIKVIVRKEDVSRATEIIQQREAEG